MSSATVTRVARARSMRRAWLPVVAVAIVVQLFAASSARAIPSLSPRIEATPSQVSIAWSSVPVGDSTVCWYDAAPPVAVAPPITPDSCVTAAVTANDHSQTLRGLPVGSYFAVAITRTVGPTLYSNSLPFEITQQAAGTPLGGDAVTDGTRITASASLDDGSRAWIAGDFEHVGFRSGPGAIVDTTSSDTVLRGSPMIERAAGRGTVTAATSDGLGGWYIAGDFTSIGGVARPGIAHILADGGLDFGPGTFAPTAGVEASGTIKALAYDAGLQRLYVGGQFTEWNNNPAARDNLVAVNRFGAIDASATAFNSKPNFAKPVNALVLDPRSDPANAHDLYVGGDFYQVLDGGNAWFSHVAKFESNGDAGCSVGCFAMSKISKGGLESAASVKALAFAPGTPARLVVGGDFDAVQYTKNDPINDVDGVLAQSNVTVVRADIGTRNTDDGAHDGKPGGAGLGTNGPVNAVAVATGTPMRIYVGGDFTSAFGDTGARDLATQTVNWPSGTVSTGNSMTANPLTGTGAVTSMVWDGALTIGGSFTVAAPAGAQYSGALTVDDNGAPQRYYGRGLDGAVNVIAPSIAPSRRFFGGTFSMYEGASSDGLAALDVDASGQPHPDPGFQLRSGKGPNGDVTTMSVKDNALAIGGAFSMVDGDPHESIAMVNSVTGAVVPSPTFDAAITGTVAEVHFRGPDLWIGGAFDDVRRNPGAPQSVCTPVPKCKNLVAIDPANGAVRSWTPAGPFGAVAAITSDASNLYVGGSFTGYNGAKGLARLNFDGTPGVALPGTDASVQHLLVDAGYLWLSGPLTIEKVPPVPVRRLARIQLNTGDVTEWDPAHSGIIGGIDEITSLAPGPGDDVFVGGSFTNFGNQVPGREQAGIALVHGTTGEIEPSFDPAPDGSVLTMSAIGSGTGAGLLVGGSFDRFASITGRAALATTSQSIDARDPKLDVTATAGTNARTAPDGTLILKNATGSTFTVRAAAHDAFVSDDAGPFAVSGLDTVELAEPPVSTSWTVNGSASSPAFSTGRGVVRTCSTGVGGAVADAVDMATDDAALRASLSALGGTPATCDWDGYLFAPEDQITSPMIAAKGGITGTINIGTDTYVLSGTPIPVPLSRTTPARLNVHWSGAGNTAVNARLEWQHGATPPVVVPTGAFTRHQPGLLTYRLTNGAEADNPTAPYDLVYRAKDVHGHAAPVRHVRVAIDKTGPANDRLFTTPTASSTAGGASVVTFRATTGDDGAGYVAGVLKREIVVEYAPWNWGLLGPSTCGAFSPIAYNPDITGDVVDNATNVALPQVYNVSTASGGRGNGCYRFSVVSTDQLNNSTRRYAGPDPADPTTAIVRVNGAGLLGNILGGAGNTVGGVLGGVGQVVTVITTPSDGVDRIRVELRNPNTGVPVATTCDSANGAPYEMPIPATWDRNEDGTTDSADDYVFPLDGDMNHNSIEDAADKFATIDMDDGTFKVACRYLPPPTVLDGPYDVVNIITPNVGAPLEIPGIPIHIDRHAPTATQNAVTDIAKFSYAAPGDDEVWINPEESAEFRLDIAADDGNGLPNGVGTGADRVVFDGSGTLGETWMSPSSASASITSYTDQGGTTHVRTFSHTYRWTGGTAATGLTDLTAHVKDGVAAHNTDVSTTVHFDSTAPTASLSYDSGNVTDASGYPTLDFSWSDGAGSGVGALEVMRWERKATNYGTALPLRCPAWDGNWVGVTPAPITVSTSGATAGATASDPFTKSWVDTSVEKGYCYKYTFRAQDRVGTWSDLDAPHSVALTDNVAISISRLVDDPVASVRESAPDTYDTIRVSLLSAPVGPVAVTLRDPATDARQQVELQVGSGAKASSVTVPMPMGRRSYVDIKVYALDDAYDEDDTHDVNLEVIGSGSDPAYAAAATTYSMHVIDNDTSATIAPPATPIVLRESGGDIGAVQIGLATKPNGFVKTTVRLGEHLVGTVDPAIAPSSNVTVEFDAAHPTRTLQVTPVNDQLVQNLPTQLVRIEPASISDARYDGISFAPILVNVTDDERAELKVSGSGEAWKSDVLHVTEGADAVELEVTALHASVGDVVVKPVVKSGSGLVVGPAQTIKRTTKDLTVAFAVRVANDTTDDGDTYDGTIEWQVTPADSAFTAKLADTKVKITDNDAAVERTVRETTPAVPVATPPAPKPTTTTIDPVKPPVAPQPRPVVNQPILPMAQPAATSDEPKRRAAKPAPKEEQPGKLRAWAKENKGKAAVAATGAAAAGAAAANVVLSKGLLGSLKGLLGAIDHLFDRHHSLNPRNFSKKNRQRLRDLANKRKARKPERDGMRRRRAKRGEEDILDELDHKYDPDYEDPLDSFERDPRSSRPDVLKDVENRLRGFDLDDAA